MPGTSTKWATGTTVFDIAVLGSLHPSHTRYLGSSDVILAQYEVGHIRETGVPGSLRALKDWFVGILSCESENSKAVWK